MLHIKFKESQMQQRGSKHFARRPRPWGSEGQRSNFSEHAYVAYYQIKGNEECSNMVENILPEDPPPPPPPEPWGGQTVKDQLFPEHGHVAYQIKWNHECSNMVLFDLIL